MTEKEFFSRYKYDIERDHLGEGGFGAVYKAFDTVLNKNVAIKIAQLRTGHETLSLKKEVELASGLTDHQNIVHYESCHRFKMPVGTFDYGVLQYYPLGNLSQLVINKKLKHTDKDSIAKGIISGIHHLHSHKIVHRDLKSANILIAKGYEGEYVPKIADFGLSKQFAENDKSYFSNSFAGGSLLYVAPEQLEGKEIRKNVDLWSLGVVLYELFVGEPPFRASVDDGSETARAEIIDKIKNGSIPPAINNLPTPWQDIIKACLIVNPAERIKRIEDVMLKAGMKAEDGKFDKTEPDTPPEIRKPEPKSINFRPLLKGFGIVLLVIFGRGVYLEYIEKKPVDQNEEVTEVVDTLAPPLDNTDSNFDDPKPEPEKELTAAERAAEEIASNMVRIPGGSFMMGCTSKLEDDCYDQDKPAHKRIVNPFWISKFEITQYQWEAIMGTTIIQQVFKHMKDQSHIRKKLVGEGSNYPMYCVSFDEIKAFIKKLNLISGLNYRLPSEAEWEYAARGGQKYKYAGSDNIDEVGWYKVNSNGETHPVGKKSPNSFGLYDMSGNVEEWCDDFYKMYGSDIFVGDNMCGDRVFRGGSWLEIDHNYVFSRSGWCPHDGSYDTGFRLAR